jgi:hypothetical protein
MKMSELWGRQKALREHHNIHMFTKVFYDSLLNKNTYACDAVHIPDGAVARSGRLDSYEEALEYALGKGIEMVNEINNLNKG